MTESVEFWLSNISPDFGDNLLLPLLFLLHFLPGINEKSRPPVWNVLKNIPASLPASNVLATSNWYSPSPSRGRGTA